MANKDYYKILGVNESAGTEEVKKKYRELAKKYHPDANPGDSGAEARFKDISEAYEVLRNPEKRKQYDQMRRFGAAGGGFTGQGFDFSQFGKGGQGRGFTGGARGFDFDASNLFGDLGSLFSQFFDGGGQNRRKGPHHGSDINVSLTVPFELAASGGKTSFSVEKERECPVCQGGGAKPGSRVETCPTCSGRGTVVLEQGGFGVSRTCPKCYGKGQIIYDPCDRCQGRGKITGKRTYNLKIPAGTVSGQIIRLRREGNPGEKGGKAGDMLVTVRVEKHPFFKQRGNDVICDVTVGLPEAVKDTKIKVKTIHETKALVSIPAGTRDGTVFRLSGMGIWRMDKKGDQLVRVHVKLPEHPTPEEKELLERYSRACETASQKEKEVKA